MYLPCAHAWCRFDTIWQGQAGLRRRVHRAPSRDALQLRVQCSYSCLHSCLRVRMRSARVALAFVACACTGACALSRSSKRYQGAQRSALRDALGALEGRNSFVATLAERSLIQRGPHQPRDRAVLLVDLAVVRAKESREPVSDHVWLRGMDASRFDGIALGDEVRFAAETARYRRRGRYDWRLRDIGDSA